MESSPTFSWTSHHWASDPSSGGTKVLELDEKLSNYEMEMKPLLRMDAYVQEAPPQKRRYSKGGACRGLGEDHRSEDRGFGAQRPRSKSHNKESSRPAPCVGPAVQRLGSLRLGGRAEPRLLRWDLAFSPPRKSAPAALESDEESGDEPKSSTVSGRSSGGGGPAGRLGQGGACDQGLGPATRDASRAGSPPGPILSARALGWFGGPERGWPCPGLPRPHACTGWSSGEKPHHQGAGGASVSRREAQRARHSTWVGRRPGTPLSRLHLFPVGQARGSGQPAEHTCPALGAYSGNQTVGLSTPGPPLPTVVAPHAWSGPRTSLPREA